MNLSSKSSPLPIFTAILGISTLSLVARNVGYDSAGRVIWSSQPSGKTTTFSYDANGNIENITSVTPAEDQDLDGIPDYFEIRFAGTATGLVATEDTDDDGMTHLFEFAFAKDPSVSDAQDITPISLEVPDPQSGDEFFTLKYLRPQSGTQHLSYTTQISFDLMQPWLSNPPAVLETVVVQQDGGVEEVTVTFLPAVGSSDLFFMRIVAEAL